MKTLTELTWIEALIWIILMIVGLKSKSAMVLGSAGMMGVFFGLTLMSDVNWMGLILVFLNVYLLYRAIFERERKKTK